jgi:3-hydroxyisobutyrate dehydrogenase-like beta-hydroxyacid dehydrogenase
MAALEMADRLSRAGAVFVDGSIIGSAAKIGGETTVYLSGSHAERLRPLETWGLSLRILGDEIGQASAFKILYAGLTKGLQGLFTELLVGAHKLQLSEEILKRYEESYPGLTAKVGDGVAALAAHARRRAEEMAELSRTFRHYGLRTLMAPATRKLLVEISRLDCESSAGTAEREKWIKTLECFADRGLLGARSALEDKRRLP